jgi:hypothetical protein
MTGHYVIPEHPAKKILFVSHDERKKIFGLVQVLTLGKALSCGLHQIEPALDTPPHLQPHADKTLSRGLQHTP